MFRRFTVEASRSAVSTHECARHSFVMAEDVSDLLALRLWVGKAKV